MYRFISIISNGQQKNSFVLVCFMLSLAFLLYIIFSKLLIKGTKSEQNFVKVEIDDGISVYTLELFCDSGNFATDPFSGRPVTILKKDSIPPELYSAISGTITGSSFSDNYKNIKPRVIPIKTVSGTTLLYAFIPKRMYICGKNGKRAVDSIIAIDNAGNSFYEKDGIIPEILTEAF